MLAKRQILVRAKFAFLLKEQAKIQMMLGAEIDLQRAFLVIRYN
ncbi:MAG: hypothetical protein PHG87_05555 [Candidatus Omnitrophica bacterium]|nr:hypothetical protein [Candidatus Omnitrophota bacterium]